MWYAYNADVLTIHIYVQPGSKSTELAGFYDDIPKFRLNTPPIEGRANKDLLKYIAKLFEVPLRQVKLVRGEKSRRKTIQIVGSLVDPASLICV